MQGKRTGPERRHDTFHGCFGEDDGAEPYSAVVALELPRAEGVTEASGSTHQR